MSGCHRGPGPHHGVCEAAPGDALLGGPSPAGRSPQMASRDPPQVPAGPGARRRLSCGPELSVPTSRAEPAGWLLGFRGRCSPLLRVSPAPPTSASLGAWPGLSPWSGRGCARSAGMGRRGTRVPASASSGGAAPAPDLGPPSAATLGGGQGRPSVCVVHMGTWRAHGPGVALSTRFLPVGWWEGS